MCSQPWSSKAWGSTGGDCNLSLADGPLRPQADRAEMAARVGRRAHLGGLERAGRAAQGVRPGDVALSLGRAAHRAPEELLGGRCRGALPPAYRPPGPPPDGL